MVRMAMRQSWGCFYQCQLMGRKRLQPQNDAGFG